MELGTDSFIRIGVPFHPQSSMKIRTILGLSCASDLEINRNPSRIINIIFFINRYVVR